jgi:undecaprenyl pyrophosphate phosphatase UppP
MVSDDLRSRIKRTVGIVVLLIAGAVVLVRRTIVPYRYPHVHHVYQPTVKDSLDNQVLLLVSMLISVLAIFSLTRVLGNERFRYWGRICIACGTTVLAIWYACATYFPAVAGVETGGESIVALAWAGLTLSVWAAVAVTLRHR